MVPAASRIELFRIIAHPVRVKILDELFITAGIAGTLVSPARALLLPPLKEDCNFFASHC